MSRRALRDALVVRSCTVRVELVGVRARFVRRLPRLTRLLHLLLCDTFALLRPACPRLGFLPELARLFAPLPPVPAAHRPEGEERENDRDADRDQDPDPSCHQKPPPVFRSN